jgi:hypothetical protein
LVIGTGIAELDFDPDPVLFEIALEAQFGYEKDKGTPIRI